MAPAEFPLPEARTTRSTQVAKSSLAHPARPVPVRFSPRLKRGITLAEERFEEITRTAPYTWSVPSCSGEHRYVVDLKHGLCTCPDHPPEGEHCKHHAAASYVKARTAVCCGCAFRKRHRELIEVMEDHESLTWFPGDLLCRECARSHGVL
jgi:hypothetical protein